MTLREFAGHAAAVLPATVGGVRAAGDPDRTIADGRRLRGQRRVAARRRGAGGRGCTS